MSTDDEQLIAAFEDAGFEVAEVSHNRNLIRITLTDETAQADDLRTVIEDTLGEDAAMGLNIATESIDGGDTMGTVVSFRVR